MCPLSAQAVAMPGGNNMPPFPHVFELFDGFLDQASTCCSPGLVFSKDSLSASRDIDSVHSTAFFVRVQHTESNSQGLSCDLLPSETISSTLFSC